MNLINNIKKCGGAALLVAAVFATMLNACTEKIDDSALYTFTGEMMTDHFENNPELFSSYLTILGQVHQSKHSTSTVKELLAARGNYTCFAPTNEAIANFLDSLLEIGEVSSTNLEDLPDSVAEDIVFNSLIDNGNNEAYATTTFEDTVPLGLTNMNGRYITPTYDEDENKNTLIFINLYSKIIDGDIEVENGYIHTIDKVLSPSRESVAEMVMTTANMQLFGEILGQTQWDKKLTKYRDTEWEDANYQILGEKHTCRYNPEYGGLYPRERKYGYTIFVETDSVFESHGITDIASLKEWVRENNYYDDDTNMGHETSWDDDYTNDYNWLNQFVAYHILPEQLTNTTMTTLANEYGVTPTDRRDNRTRWNVNVWEYWETMGVQRRTMKVTRCRDGHYINRKSVYNQRTYKEDATLMTIPGIKVRNGNGTYDTKALNGMIFPIEDILIWNREVPTKVLNERMRYDVCALFPEMLTNNIRQNREDSWFFPYDYFDNIYYMDPLVEFEYMPNTGWAGSTTGWLDYQIDEFNIRGPVDFTMKLPPVPYTGTYELRFGVWTSDRRGMVQVYLGKNPNNLPAIGIPLDLRDTGVGTALTGWVSEATIGTDSTAIYEQQKSMRNLGFMKGPKYIQVSDGTARDTGGNVRKILYTGQFEAGETYWIRFKTALSSNSKEFFYDFIELVPKTVYAGESNEDIW